MSRLHNLARTTTSEQHEGITQRCALEGELNDTESKRLMFAQ